MSLLYAKRKSGSTVFIPNCQLGQVLLAHPRAHQIDILIAAAVL